MAKQIYIKKTFKTKRQSSNFFKTFPYEILLRYFLDSLFVFGLAFQAEDDSFSTALIVLQTLP